MKKLIFLCLFAIGCHSTPAYQDEVTGEIAVDFADDVSESYIADLGRKLSIHFTPESDYSSIDKVYIGTYYGSDEASAIDALQHDSNVEAADRDDIYTIPEHNLTHEGLRAAGSTPTHDGFPNDPRFSDQWHMRQIHLPKNWGDNVRDGAPNGYGTVVAVIDTGVSRTADMNQTNFANGYNFVSNNIDAHDDHGHGTHVAGTIAQSTNNGIGVAGVAYRATIMPIKVLSAEGSGTTASIAQGIHWATDHGADVINMSLGGGRYNSMMAKAVKYAHDKGVVVVCASGNSARGTVSYPAAYPGAIAVAATQKDERVTFYSNWGKEITIAAPGGNTREDKTGGVLQNSIVEGRDDYYYFMGTSMASPHIAGVAALIVSEGIKRQPDKVRQILVETARDPIDMDKKPDDYADHYGAGIVDADKALEKARSSAPVSTSHKIKIAIYILILLALVVIIVSTRKKK